MEKTKIALGCDHIGFSLKEQIKKYLIQEKNAEIVIDPIQTEEEGNGTFIETTRLICEGIQQDTCRLALMICGTGLGFCSVANTYWGIRAAHASEPYTARRARKSLNAQILCLGCRVMSLEYCKMVVDAFYDEPFDWTRTSSVLNLKLMEKFEYQREPKPANVSWSMGFFPDV
ncbi:MAG: RpiB/LacA/LacB family sugar-phosphate isomerase [Ruthenibacterium sp.]|nr:RpiB/LacA/LacB family sugar-phosphate isomerase [Oscillospiraceae bacterium]